MEMTHETNNIFVGVKTEEMFASILSIGSVKYIGIPTCISSYFIRICLLFSLSTFHLNKIYKYFS